MLAFLLKIMYHFFKSRSSYLRGANTLNHVLANNEKGVNTIGPK